MHGWNSLSAFDAEERAALPAATGVVTAKIAARWIILPAALLSGSSHTFYLLGLFILFVHALHIPSNLNIILHHGDVTLEPRKSARCLYSRGAWGDGAQGKGGQQSG